MNKRSHLTARTRRPASRQRGMVLFVSLILLLILTLLGVTVARMQTGEERMAQNDQNHLIAMQAAEAALRFAETGLLQGLYTQFANNAAGLYVKPTASSVLDALSWTAPGGAVLTYTGPALSSLTLSAPPVFLIESLPAVCAPGQQCNNEGYANSVPPVTIFRVTAHGYGADATSGATLQTIFK